MKSYFILSFLLMLALLQGTASDAQAVQRGLSINQSRVIFPAASSGVSVTLRNYSDRPWLARALVLTAPDGVQDTHFMMTPPLFRLEPDSKGMVRVLRRGNAVLPDDRESVFYLSFLAIPPSQKTETGEKPTVSAQVTVGIDMVIKLFYRPDGLTLEPPQAAQMLTVSRQKDGIRITNPTPYYQTLVSLSLDGAPAALSGVESMIAPFSSLSYPIAGHPREARWSVMNDYGGTSPIYSANVSDGEIP